MLLKYVAENMDKMYANGKDPFDTTETTQSDTPLD